MNGVTAQTLGGEQPLGTEQGGAPVFQEISQIIRHHSHAQIAILQEIYAYLARSTLRKEKDSSNDEEKAYNRIFPLMLFAISVKHCPNAMQDPHHGLLIILFRRSFLWPGPGHKLLLKFGLFSVQSVDTQICRRSLWIFDKTEQVQKLHAVDSPEAKIQPPAAKSLGHQASTLRAIVRYLENTLQCKLFPHYKKSCASSLARMGFHRSLVGEMASRPTLPNADQVVKFLGDYSSLLGQPYPLNVRLPVVPVSDFAKTLLDLPSEPAFQNRQNLYQKVITFIRNDILEIPIES